MIIESENQYQQALAEIQRIFENNNNVPPDPESTSGKRLTELMTEIKFYENKFHNPTAEELPTFEFWVAKKGVVITDDNRADPENYTIEKLKENELTQQHIDTLVAEFYNNFEKLPAKARRILRQKLRY